MLIKIRDIYSHEQQSNSFSKLVLLQWGNMSRDITNGCCQFTRRYWIALFKNNPNASNLKNTQIICHIAIKK